VVPKFSESIRSPSLRHFTMQPPYRRNRDEGWPNALIAPPSVAW
jgi:hypothetical protein